MRRGKSPQNINEEVNKMRRLMNFDISQNSHDVLSESNIEKSVLSEQTTGSTESSLGNSMSRVKIDSGVEIGEEYIGDYKKVKLEITGPKKEVGDILRKLRVNGCIPIGKPSSSVIRGEDIKLEKDGKFLGQSFPKYQRGEMIRSYSNEYLVPKELDYKTL